MKLVKEILVIIFVSVLLAFAYNWYQVKPLPLIYTPKEFDKVADDELFGSDTSQVSIEDETLIKDEKVIADEKAEEVQSAENINDIPKNEKLSLTNSADIHNRTVTYSQMLKIIASPNKFLVIDARNHEQFIENKIGNAINIFPYNENFDEVANKILSLPKGKTLIVYCDGGECDSSHKLADILVDFGYSNLYIYTGGWEEWAKNNGLEM